MSILGSIAGVASGLLSPIVGAWSSRKNNKDSIKAQNDINQQNYASSKEFAQNSIKWKAQDAREAGFHPLASLGQQASYAPTAMSAAGQSDDSGYLANLTNSLGQVAANLAEALNADKRSELAGQMQDLPNIEEKRVDVNKNLTSAIKKAVNSDGAYNEAGGQYSIRQDTNKTKIIGPAQDTMQHEQDSEGNRILTVGIAFFRDQNQALKQAAYDQKNDPSGKYVAVFNPFVQRWRVVDLTSKEQFNTLSRLELGQLVPPHRAAYNKFKYGNAWKDVSDWNYR
ncbi:DNA pilot protein [Dipodfec virus UOA04_Rod_985]|nr:DNA pilot protein [Dipodfec virus UOA04_Rod_985]